MGDWSFRYVLRAVMAIAVATLALAIVGVAYLIGWAAAWVFGAVVG